MVIFFLSTPCFSINNLCYSPSQNILEDDGACGETEKENNSLMSLIINKDNNREKEVVGQVVGVAPSYPQCKVSAINLSTPKCSPVTTSPFTQQPVIMKQVRQYFRQKNAGHKMATSTLMPKCLLYLRLCCAHSCVYTCPVHTECDCTVVL